MAKLKHAPRITNVRVVGEEQRFEVKFLNCEGLESKRPGRGGGGGHFMKSRATRGRGLRGRVGEVDRREWQKR